MFRYFASLEISNWVYLSSPSPAFDDPGIMASSRTRHKAVQVGNMYIVKKLNDQMEHVCAVLFFLFFIQITIYKNLRRCANDVQFSGTIPWIRDHASIMLPSGAD